MGIVRRKCQSRLNFVTHKTGEPARSPNWAAVPAQAERLCRQNFAPEPSNASNGPGEAGPDPVPESESIR